MKKIIGIMCIAMITQAIASPQGFKIISSDGGVTIYKKLFENGSTDYVQEIDLSKGARIKLLVGELEKIESNYGDNKGDKYWLIKQSIKDTWDDSIKENDNTKCITNGEYFGTGKYNQSTLSYPIKIDGDIYDGSSTIYKKYQKVLNITNEEVSIKAFEDNGKTDEEKRKNLNAMLDGDNSIVGLDTSLNYGGYKASIKRKGRTFIGILDKNKDGINETILIYNSGFANQKDAKDTLISFGASSKNMMMLDGGGSSQLICDGQTFVKSSDGSRILPQFISTIKGESQELSYEDKVNFIFNNFEEKLASHFPKGVNTIKSGNYFYREYEVIDKKHYLLAYNKIIYYNIGGRKFTKLGSVNKFYDYFNQ